MSRTTNPDAEYYVTCGFFNSDSASPRKYDAVDFSKLFDGLITDGVFASIGDKLLVKATSGNTVNIGTGKCWFNHTWTSNTDTLPIVCDPAENLLNRIDAIVLEVNSTQSVRDNCFKYIKGAPASEPVKPTLINDTFVHQHALCYITRPKGSTEITQANIENVIGTSETPFITAILQTVSIDELLAQWQVEFDKLLFDRQSQVNTFIAENEKKYDDSIAAKEKDVDNSIAAKEAEFDEAIAAKELKHDTWSAEIRAEMESLLSEVNLWYNNTSVTIDGYLTNMKNKLGQDPATSLQMQIDEGEIRNVLANGFAAGIKNISEDNSVITSTNSDGWTLVTTFTNEFLTATTILTDSNGAELGRLVKNISSDGSKITSEITLL